MNFQGAVRRAHEVLTWKRGDFTSKLCSYIPKWTDSVAVMVLLLITTAMWVPRRAGPIDLRVDAAVYYVLGTSLAQGDGYRLLNEPGDIRAVQYPPLVPGIIAADQFLAGRSDTLVAGRSLKRLWFVFFLLFLLFSYYYFRRTLCSYWAFTGALMCALNVELLFYSNQCTAEIPFALISVIFVLVHRNLPRYQVLSAILATSAFFCRTIGIALFATWVVDALTRKQFRNAALRSSLAAICLLSWGAYIRSVEKSSEYRKPAYPYQRAAYMFYDVSYSQNVIYKDPFRPELGKASLRDRLARFIENTRAIPRALGEAVSTYKLYWDEAPATLNRQIRFHLLPASIGLVFMDMVGWFVLISIVLLLLRKRELLVALYVLFTLFIACCAPWQQIVRYMLPTVPFLLCAFFEGLRSTRLWLATTAPPWGKRLAGGFISAGLALIVGQQALSLVIASRYSMPETYRTSRAALIQFPQFLFQDEDVALGQAADWIRDHAEPGDILAAAMPQWVYLKTGLKTVMPPFESDPKRADSLLDSVPVRYLIIESKSRMGDSAKDYMSSVVRAFLKEWPVVYTNREATVRVFEHAASAHSE